VKTFRFGISRSHAGPQLLESAKRFAAVVGGVIRRSPRVIVARSYEHMEEGVLTGGIDVAWMPPLIQLRMIDAGADLSVVSERQGAVVYRSALLVAADSAYQRVADLRRARMAWSDRYSASGYLFPLLQLRAAGIDESELSSQSFAGSATSAVTAVLDGRADVCSVHVSNEAAESPQRALVDVRAQWPQIESRLRVLAVSDAIAPDGMILGSALQGGFGAHVRDVLLGLHHSDEGRESLRQLLQADRLAPVTANVVRTLTALQKLVAQL
jgi:phosphonate transport system substrate-binding protein